MLNSQQKIASSAPGASGGDLPAAVLAEAAARELPLDRASVRTLGGGGPAGLGAGAGDRRRRRSGRLGPVLRQPGARGVQGAGCRSVKATVVDHEYAKQRRRHASTASNCERPERLGVSTGLIYASISTGKLTARRGPANRLYIPFPPHSHGSRRDSLPSPGSSHQPSVVADQRSGRDRAFRRRRRAIPGGEPPELDQPRLLGRQLQVELRKPSAKVSVKPLCVLPILEPHHVRSTSGYGRSNEPLLGGTG